MANDQPVVKLFSSDPHPVPRNCCVHLTPIFRNPGIRHALAPKPRERPAGPEHGGNDGRGVSDPSGRLGGLEPRVLLQLRTRAVSGADLPYERSQDMLPHLRFGKGIAHKHRVVPKPQTTQIQPNERWLSSKISFRGASLISDTFPLFERAEHSTPGFASLVFGI